MLYYLSGTRYPSAKAHAIQQLKMCDAFAHHETVTLVLPRPERPLRWTDLAEQYGLTHPIQIKHPPTLSHDQSLPLSGVPNTDNLLTAAWLLYQSVRGRIGHDDVVYARDPHPLQVYLRFGDLVGHQCPASIWFEQHQVDRGLPEQFYDCIDGVVAIAETQRSRMQDTIAPLPATTVVAHDGVDLAPYDTMSKADARAELGIDADTSLVAYTGRLYPSKDVESLVAAAGSFDAECYIVGGDPAAIDRIRHSMDVPDSVTFTGHVQPAAVPRYQLAADVLVATYAEESSFDYFSPLKLFEYMASRTASVVAYKPAFEEVLADGETTLFVPPEDPPALAEAVGSLLDDPTLRSTLADRARAEVEAYTWQRRARRILDVVDQYHGQVTPGVG